MLGRHLFLSFERRCRVTIEYVPRPEYLEDNHLDPRRRLDEKFDKLRSSEVPFIETYNEIVLVEQPLGKPSECEVVVVRIGKSKLKFLAFILTFFLFLAVITAFQI